MCNRFFETDFSNMEGRICSCLRYRTRGVILYESWLHQFLANSFLGLQLYFRVHVWYTYICLDLIDLSKKSAFCLFKTEFKAKNMFARNRCSQLRRTVHTKPDL